MTSRRKVCARQCLLKRYLIGWVILWQPPSVFHDENKVRQLESGAVDINTLHAPPWPCFINSLAPGRFQRNFRKAIFQLILVIDALSISCKIVFKWMPMGFSDGKSKLVQVMAWCRQATSHYLSQCWPRFLSPYGIIRLQRVTYWPAWMSNYVCFLCDLKLRHE